MTRRTRSTGSLSRPGRWARGAVGVAVLFLASEILGRAGIVDRTYFPPATTITARAIGLLADSGFVTNLLLTLKAWALGLLISAGAGVPLGLLLGSLPGVNTAVRAVVEFLRPIPPVAIIPFALLLLGSGLEMKLTLIVFSAIWPVLYNTIYGLQGVDPGPKEALRTFGFGRFAVLWRVSFPAAAPFIATGIRLAASIALAISVSAEIVSGFGDGLGMFITQAGNVPDGAKDVLAATVWAGVLGLVINSVLMRVERRLFRWHQAHGGAA